MVAFIILGIVWLMCLEHFLQQQNDSKLQNYIIRLGNFILWPVMVIIFIYYFIKEMEN